MAGAKKRSKNAKIKTAQIENPHAKRLVLLVKKIWQKKNGADEIIAKCSVELDELSKNADAVVQAYNLEKKLMLICSVSFANFGETRLLKTILDRVPLEQIDFNFSYGKNATGVIEFFPFLLSFPKTLELVLAKVGPDLHKLNLRKEYMLFLLQHASEQFGAGNYTLLKQIGQNRQFDALDFTDCIQEEQFAFGFKTIFDLANFGYPAFLINMLNANNHFVDEVIRGTVKKSITIKNGEREINAAAAVLLLACRNETLPQSYKDHIMSFFIAEGIAKSKALSLVTDLHSAIFANDVAKATRAITQDKKDFFGLPAFELAVQGNRNEITKAFYEAGLLPNAESKKLSTSLLAIFITKGNVEMVKYLLEKGVTQEYEEGTALPFAIFLYATSHEHSNPKITDALLDIIEILISKGANINAQSKAGETPMHFILIMSKAAPAMLNKKLLSLFLSHTPRLNLDLKSKEGISVRELIEDKEHPAFPLIQNIKQQHARCFEATWALLQKGLPWQIAEHVLTIDNIVKEPYQTQSEFNKNMKSFNLAYFNRKNGPKKQAEKETVIPCSWHSRRKRK